MINPSLIAVRGAGDLATGVIVRLMRCGYRVIALETACPSVIRRTVALAEAVPEGRCAVEGVTGLLVADPAEALRASADGLVAVLVDPELSSLGQLRPAALVDAIIAKRNCGTDIGLAPVVIGLGPGFEAGVDVHAVVETNRGHDLGRVFLEGQAAPDTGVPGVIAGYGKERVIRAPCAGTVEPLLEIGDLVAAGAPLARLRGVTEAVVSAPFAGIVRGMIRPGFLAPAGFKIADVDPRCERDNCFTVSDKARAIAGGVLEALLAFGIRP
ncbi:MAG TPA: EF2563 family selenium-dependent molybdenum hydroxylase system protein [Spirochaetaceae bacterium]|nr:molybdenum hydroxylase [Spirochaetaceae bacterium]HAW85763.1 molybdenum hydroxylase [Spirochaetaceae bacterium]HAX36936.1 molybdenum hydroxylase [Spirochaetaceae bacterium]HBO39681.1 EF2563 family selenium-dependent molybdenum hydroxylase system protein [Spirochaetaceae bacterium]HCQ86408.1 EF2563 family selenium-dependent molybdenum hydroxylase system protein [Spirochaetaceae bacterium]